VAVEDREQPVEVDRAIARHGESAVDDRLQEAPVAVAREPDDERSHVLAVDVADARDVLLQHRDGAAAGEGHVAAVEQQADRAAGDLHQRSTSSGPRRSAMWW
jgi:hypothetical protein